MSHNLNLLANILPLNGGLTFHGVILAEYVATPFLADIPLIINDGNRFSQKVCLV
jgi:hypothetical protein